MSGHLYLWLTESGCCHCLFIYYTIYWLALLRIAAFLVLISTTPIHYVAIFVGKAIIFIVTLPILFLDGYHNDSTAKTLTRTPTMVTSSALSA